MTNSKPTLRQQKVHIETWGCQMNVADSEEILHLLQKENYESVDDPQAADLVVLNTCHIREKAKHKMLSRLGVLREVQKSKPDMKIVVAGCVAQAEGKKLLKQAPNIDVLLGPGKIQDLPKLIENHQKSGEPTYSLGFNKTLPIQSSETQAHDSLSGRTDISRFVNIAQGCNNFCTFCVVPFTRGREISKSLASIVAESEQLILGGSKEITLLGQNVNSYGKDLLHPEADQDTEPFVELLKAVAKIEGLERLRFTTSNPHDFTRGIADLFKSEPKLGKYLHLPVQSGSDTVLKRMKRKVTAEEYHSRVAWLREIPEFALSTDLIVGFPGETVEQFEETVELIKQVQFSFIYSFKYSPRSGTAAARFREQVSEEEKNSRLQKLNEVQSAITIEQNLNEIGKEREVLVHYKSKKGSNIYYGRTEQFRLVKIESNRCLVGKTVGVKIVDGNKTGLAGELL